MTHIVAIEQINRAFLARADQQMLIEREVDAVFAKARMRGDGPPYVKLGRSIRIARALWSSG